MNINNFLFNDIWENKNLNTKNYKNLNSFFWLFTLDLKSSKKDIQSIIGLTSTDPDSKLNNLEFKKGRTDSIQISQHDLSCFVIHG